MELPSVASLTHMEATARVNFADGDDPSEYSPIYQEPFRFILEMAHHLPRANRGVAAQGCRYKNWEHWLDGYSEWGVPEEETGNLGLAALVRTMAVQHLYFTTDKPEVQLKKLFAAPVERSLAAFGATRACEELGQKVFVLKIEIHPMCTSTRDDFCGRSVDPVIVWRLATCFGDTNIDSFHDQITAPSFGWRRHYHSYQFFCPGSGAMLGPTKSDAIDMMHVGTKGQYMLDSEKYDVRHVLRKKGQRLGYIYDLGDGWLHMITVVDIVDKGTMLEKGVSSDPRINNEWDAQVGSKGVAVNGAQGR